MRKIFCMLLFFIFLAPCGFSDSIWEIPQEELRGVLIDNALADDNSFFEQKKQERINQELEEKLNVKLVPISLDECLKTAVEHNYIIKQQKATAREALWNKRNAYSKFLPNANYTFTSQWLSGTYLVGGIVPVDVHENPLSSSFNFEWSFFDQGKVFFDVSQKRSLQKSADALAEFSKDEIILNTAQSYYQLLKNRAELEIYAINVIDRKTQYDMTMARYAVGVGTRFDIYRAEAELEKSKQEYIESVNAIRIAQAKLANYMGIDVLTPLYPKEIVINKKTLLDTDAETMIGWAKKSRLDLYAEKKKIDAMKAERNAVYTDLVPDITFKFSSSMYGTRRSGLYPSDTLTLNVVAPFGSYCGVDTFTKIKSYKYQILAAENNLTQLIRNVEEAIISSKQNSDSASERIVASEKEVFASRKSLESAVILMQTGTQTFLDVIQAQNLKVNAQVRLTECITDYNISQVQLLFESGIITIDNVLNGINQPPLGNQGQAQNSQQNQQQNPSQNLPQNQSQNSPQNQMPQTP